MKLGQPAAYDQGWVTSVAEVVVPTLLAQHAVPGLALATLAQGQITALRGYGYADQRTLQPMHPDTILNVASLSKPVAAWGVLHLAEQHSLDLDAPIISWLRHWQLPPSAFNPAGITLRRLLSHTAGLSMPSVPWFPAEEPTPTLVQVLGGAAGDRGAVVLERAPGSAWSYSGGGYMVLELLVETISGVTFAEYMHDALFAPLGMDSSTFAPSSHVLGGAVGYDASGMAIAPYRLVGAAAGGLFTTVADLARLLSAYYPSEEKPAGRGVLSSNLVAQMSTAVAYVHLPGVALENVAGGLGHFVHTCADGSTLVYHSGGNPGIRAYMLLHLAAKDGLVLITNSDNGAALIGDLLRRWEAAHNYDLPPLF